MSHPAHQLAVAVASAINALALTHAGSPVTAEAAYLTTHDLKELAALRVDVLPTGFTRETLTRSADALELDVAVAVQKRCDPKDQAALGELMQLTHTIARSLIGVRPQTLPGAINVSQTQDPLYFDDLLESQRVFLAIVNLTYRVQEARP